MAKNTDQAFESIRIVGGLISSKVLQDARRYDLPGQSKEHYQIEPGLTFNDDIGRYWRIAQARWQEFQLQCQRQDISSHTIAQREWLIPLLEKVLGYRLEISEPVMLGEREFPITHSAFNHAVPLVLCGAEYDLDKGDAIFGQEGRKRSPMGLLQEYLNAESTALWAIVSNGLVLRLLRDNPAMTRPAYIEVDFARMFEEDNYADFATLWLTLHATRLEPQNNHPEQCWLEQWRGKGQDEGERALDKLRYGVADALRQLGTGFVAHKNNQALREKLANGELSTDAYFQQVLRLVYRFLFLLTSEDRNVALLPEEYEGQNYTEARKLYEQGYSLNQLREKARLKRHYDNYGDAWQQLLITFAGFAQGQPLLAQPALGGLFAKDQCADLEVCELQNRHLFSALFNLCYFEHDRVLARINYRDMDTEEFGSVYESLLELIPQLNTEGTWQFSFMGDAEDEKSASGHSRKLTGSYYTPDSLVQELIKSALEPVIVDRLKENPKQPRAAILSITVCDPACGSGHFLLAAARRLATELAKIDAGSDQATEEHYRHAIRDVVRHCIYGVDLNPMAVELCKTGLWLESIEIGKPLSFLDHHLKVGNSLLGVSKEKLDLGIPGDAYKATEFDSKNTINLLKKKNASEVQDYMSGQLGIFSKTSADEKLYAAVLEVEAHDSDSIEDVSDQKSKYLRFIGSESFKHQKFLHDLWCSIFLWTKDESSVGKICPTEEDFRCFKENIESVPLTIYKNVDEINNQYKLFHWHLEFPKVFDRSTQSGNCGGFDVVLGNPPWEKLQTEEIQFFSIRDSQIANLSGAKRKAAIKRIVNDGSELAYAWRNKRKKDVYTINFIRQSGEFPLTGIGKFNAYALFAELNVNILGSKGFAGFIVPTGIATDDNTKRYFSSICTQGNLISLFDFENRKPLFTGVHRMFKFSLVTICGTGSRFKPEQMNFAFFLNDPNEVIEKKFTLTVRDIESINPNTGNCPVFRTAIDAEINKYVYGRMPVLLNENNPQSSGWDCRAWRLINTTDDSAHFVGAEESLGTLVPLYEAKMIHQFDHRFAMYDDGGTEITQLSSAQKENNSFYSIARYYLSNEYFISRLPARLHQKQWFLTFRNITNASNERTTIASIIPRAAGCEVTPYIELNSGDSRDYLFLLAMMNSFVFDYFSRQKVGGTHLSYFILYQLPVIKPGNVDVEIKDIIESKALELVYTSSDLKQFASDCGYFGEPIRWNNESRLEAICDLNALFFYLYLGSPDDWGSFPERLKNEFDSLDDVIEYILDSFPITRKREINEFGEYRTRKLILDAWKKINAGNVRAIVPKLKLERSREIALNNKFESMASGAFRQPKADLQAETVLQLAAILRACVNDISIQNARFALLVAMEPRILVPFLNSKQRVEWLRLNGSDAAPLADGVTRLQPNTQRQWGEAIRQLRGNGLLIENLQARTWSPGEGLNEFPSQAWAEGRARFVMAWLNSGVTVVDVVSELPQELRGWLNENVA